MNKHELARQYREKYGWDIPTAKLARIMYQDNKLLFKDSEHARLILRYIEGKTGKKMPKNIAHKLDTFQTTIRFGFR